jgi:xylose isomerase
MEHTGCHQLNRFFTCKINVSEKASSPLLPLLGGENFNFWGGREGYSYLPTTDLVLERNHAALFFKMAAHHWREVLGAAGPLLIEPKPQEPSKHQYDWDVATTAGFLR